ncbi:MAG: hypothetical protein Q9209_005440 [Squamulea sp. 1 TL-2023]
MSFQRVLLDNTLKDLYSLDEMLEEEVALVYGMPDAKVQLTSPIPLSKKFAYQSPISREDDRDLLARLMLQVVPQVFGSIAGNMTLVMFDVDEGKSEQSQAPLSPVPSYRADASRTFAQLAKSEAPNVKFVIRPEDIKHHPAMKIAVAHLMDCLLHLQHTVSPDAHYELLSKTYLALSSLTTPVSDIVNTKLQPHQLQDETLLNEEVARMMETVLQRPLPFVVKMPLAVLGQGVFLIRTEADRKEGIEVLTRELKPMLRQLNDSNAHLKPSSLVLQELIPGESVSLSLFITRDGRPIMTSCCRQISDSAGNWGGAYISYKEQDSLQRQYAGTIEKLATYVHSKGFYGPMGVDVMTDQESRQSIIDLNIRVTGSHPLGFLKSHFSTKRGLDEAVVLFPLLLRYTRDVSESAFENEFMAGSIMINGWCHDKTHTFR